MTSHATSGSAKTALCVGLCRIDWIQVLPGMPGSPRTEGQPGQIVEAGGPATTAAATFAFLGGEAILLTGVGNGSRADEIRTDLQHSGVRLVDAAEDTSNQPASRYLRFDRGVEGPSVSSTLNTPGSRLTPPSSLDALVDESHAVLVDSHYPDLANAAVRAARKYGRLCLLDGRDWKKVTPHLLSFADIAVCSKGSHVRDTRRRVPKDVLGYLLGSGASRAVVTDGPRPISWASQDYGVQPDVAVPVTAVADTLGASDVFCGALMHAITGRPAVDNESFGAALQFAARVAAYSCQSFGTRTWMNSWQHL